MAALSERPLLASGGERSATFAEPPKADPIVGNKTLSEPQNLVPLGPGTRAHLAHEKKATALRSGQFVLDDTSFLEMVSLYATRFSGQVNSPEVPI